MEPSSILTIVATSVSVIVKTSLALKELSQKYHSADQEISFIIIRLNTIEAIVSQIGSWLRSEETLQHQMAKDIKMAVSACDFVVGEIYKHVEYVQDGWFGGRIRQLWNEEQQLHYQRNLDSQISSLGVLLNVAVLYDAPFVYRILQYIQADIRFQKIPVPAAPAPSRSGKYKVSIT